MIEPLAVDIEPSSEALDAYRGLLEIHLRFSCQLSFDDTWRLNLETLKPGANLLDSFS